MTAAKILGQMAALVRRGKEISRNMDRWQTDGLRLDHPHYLALASERNEIRAKLNTLANAKAD